MLLGMNWGIAQENWELVYPESRPTVQEAKVLSSGYMPELRMFLAGSHEGTALAAVFGENSPTIPWTVIKLPVEFDILAVAEADGRWVVAGNEGQVAVHGGVSPSAEDAESLSRLEGDWTVSSVGTDSDITAIAAVSGAIIVLADGQLFLTLDRGQTWSRLDQPGRVDSLVAYRDTFYAIESEDIPGPDGIESPAELRTERVRLLSSTGGLEWTLEWEIDELPYMPPNGQTGEKSLHVMSTVKDPAGLPVPGASRLVADIDRWRLNEALGNWERFTGQFSKQSDSVWLDHGAVALFSHHNYGLPDQTSETRQWNPLNLPASRRNFPRFTLEPVRALPALENHDPLRITRNTVSEWDKIAFRVEAPQGAVMVTIDKKGRYQAFDIPEVISHFAYYGLYWKGDYYMSTSRGISKTSDFVSYTSASGSGLVPGNSNLALVTDYSIYSGKKQIELPAGVESVAYHTALNAWCLLRHDSEIGLIIQTITESGATTEITRLLYEDYYQFRQLCIPDGKTIITRSTDGELVIIHPDGSARRSQPWESFPVTSTSISSIDFVNGWFYVMGKTALRTKDFLNYEEVPLPTDESYFKMLGFNGWLYAFTSKGVYRHPLERGYLNSIQMENDWYHSDWLGWFTIIDQTAGLIDHLRLGRTKVLKQNQNNIWLDTATLGILSIRTDWMPWVWRQETGSWYYLDMNAWPPKAWDLDANQWIHLNP